MGDPVTQDQWDISTGFAPPDVGSLERDGFEGRVAGSATTDRDTVADDAPAAEAPAAEAIDASRIAEQAGLRRRTLSDVARDLRVQGDRVVVSVGGRHFTGVVTHAAGDLATLDTPAGDLHTNLRRIDYLRVTEPSASTGVERPSGPSSFKARLFELELAGRELGIGIEGHDDELRATIRAVGVDHLLLDDADGEGWVVPLTGVAYAVAPNA